MPSGATSAAGSAAKPGWPTPEAETRRYSAADSSRQLGGRFPAANSAADLGGRPAQPTLTAETALTPAANPDGQLHPPPQAANSGPRLRQPREQPTPPAETALTPAAAPNSQLQSPTGNLPRRDRRWLRPPTPATAPGTQPSRGLRRPKPHRPAASTTRSGQPRTPTHSRANNRSGVAHPCPPSRKPGPNQPANPAHRPNPGEPGRDVAHPTHPKTQAHRGPRPHTHRRTTAPIQGRINRGNRRPKHSPQRNPQ